MTRPRLTLEQHETIEEYLRIARQAVSDAQEESRRLGVPNVYSINGRIYYELPNGELSLNDPWVPPQERASGCEQPEAK
jgi:hypothetical protein